MIPASLQPFGGAGFYIAVVNAQHIKVVPVRKTGVKDAEYIADLLGHGEEMVALPRPGLLLTQQVYVRVS